MDIIQWVLDNGNRVQLTLSTCFDDLDIEMRLHGSTIRYKQLLSKADLKSLPVGLVDVLDWMRDELLKEDLND